MNKNLVLPGLLVFVVVSSVYAIEPDEGYPAYEKRHKTDRARQDKQIDRKLADLEKRFGRKPNTSYILTDDIGWGELGRQGSGKHRGTPTAALDKMAAEGMSFWSAYAEPSCTPTRIAINTGRHPVRTGLLSVLRAGQTEGLSPEEVTAAELLSLQSRCSLQDTWPESGDSGTAIRPSQRVNTD